MTIPLQITFRGMDSSELVTRTIEKQAEKLERLIDRASRCHVVIESPHRHHLHGNAYSVHVDLRFPRGEVAVSRTGAGDPARENLHAAIRDAFEAVVRKLEDRARGRRPAHARGREETPPLDQAGPAEEPR